MRNIYAFLFFKSSYIPFFASHIKGYLFCCRYHPKTVIHHLQSEKCIYNLWEFVDDRKLNRRFREMSFSNICKAIHIHDCVCQIMWLLRFDKRFRTTFTTLSSSSTHLTQTERNKTFTYCKKFTLHYSQERFAQISMIGTQGQILKTPKKSLLSDTL